MYYFLVVAQAAGLCGIQARMDFNSCTQTLMRHDSAEMVKLSDLFVFQVTNVYGPSQPPFPGLGVFSDKDKTNTTGQLEWSAAIRHKDAMHCAIGSIALFLFFRWQVERSPVPDFSSRASWYFDYLSPGRGATADTRISKTTFTDTMKKALLFLGLLASHYSHFMRVYGVFLAAEYLVHRETTLLIGRWLRDKLAVHYQKCAKPADGLVGMAGFNAGSPTLIAAYRIPRSEVEPPQELLDLVFPWRLTKLEVVKARNAAALAAPKDKAVVDASDRQAEVFVSQVLPFLATVLLQDLAVMQNDVCAAPHCPALFHSV